MLLLVVQFIRELLLRGKNIIYKWFENNRFSYPDLRSEVFGQIQDIE
jgi:hypothetical protein